ncbi:MAG: glycosyltransferase family 2 protein [Myxococcota bacterium]
MAGSGVSSRRPRVSVVLPVHDAEATLGEALDSIRVQTLADHEVVVALNGVTDGSVGVARRFAARDARVRLLELEQADLVHALNAGLEAARAPLIARLDADDRMLPERLERQVAALDAHPHWTLVTCGVRCTAVGDAAPGRGMVRHVAWLNGLDTPGAIRAARFVDAPVAHPATVFRLTAVQEAGGYRAGDFPEDHDLWLRLLESGAVFGRVQDVLVEWRDHPHRLTRTDSRLRDEARRRLVHRFVLRGPLAGGRRARIWGAGRYGKRHARSLVAMGARVDALIDIDPRKIGGRIAGGIPVVHADTVGPPDGRLTLLAVASPGARSLIAAHLERRGHVAERDYVALQ